MEPVERGSKVYLEIVKQLRSMIEQDGLKPGDKIPSERELCERLNVGRSSVREALRALELLGLIETRRGEGTFIRDFRSNQLVQLLGTFVLQDSKAKQDVIETKYLIELDCLRLILRRNNVNQLEDLKKWLESCEFTDDQFFIKIVELADNHLFYRIWSILNDYYDALKLPKMERNDPFYLAIVQALLGGNEADVLKSYYSLRKLSND
ncbi:FadR/GntR family transcriptional regulator [Robertmurraya sp. FSL R5-0851]|jgi:DNA-binding FadR family transcriptional regulator|uniref:FadR/GntR family transcriptional regulator n=1 Tax=Robertmurraya sp. FSL R5-0851 TaxID=2921584 RepID=UPI0030F65186